MAKGLLPFMTVQRNELIYPQELLHYARYGIISPRRGKLPSMQSLAQTPHLSHQPKYAHTERH